MSRRNVRKIPDSDPPAQPEPMWMRGKKRRLSPGRLAGLILMGIPIFVCVAVSIGMGRKPMMTAGTETGERSGVVGKPVVAVMRAAPIAAESEGGMPVDLLRLIDEPERARQQTDRVALLYHRWAQGNPREAAQSALAHVRLFESLKPLESVLGEWLSAEPEEGMDWVVEASMSPGKAERVEEAFGQVIAGKPVEIRAAWAARFPDDRGPVAEVAAEWARSDGPAAVAWLTKLTPGEAKTAGVRALVSSWMEVDPARAGLFVAGMPRGTLREVALATVTEISPGGVALDPAREVATDGREPKAGDAGWVVRDEPKSGPPRTLRRLPIAK